MSGDDGGSGEIVGYCIVAAGVLDLLAALFLLLTEKPPNPDQRRNLVLILSMAGAGMIGLGVCFWMGVIG